MLTTSSKKDFFEEIKEEEFFLSPIKTLIKIDKKLTELYLKKKNNSDFIEHKLYLNIFEVVNFKYKNYLFLKIKFEHEKKKEILFNHLNLINILREDLIILYNFKEKSDILVAKGKKISFKLLENFIDEKKINFDKISKKLKIDSLNMYKAIFKSVKTFLNPSLDSSNYFISKNFYKNKINFDFKKFLKNPNDNKNDEKVNIKSKSYLVPNYKKKKLEKKNNLKIITRKKSEGKNFLLFYANLNDKDYFIMNFDKSFFIFKGIFKRNNIINENLDSLYSSEELEELDIFLDYMSLDMNAIRDLQFFMKKNNFTIIGKIQNNLDKIKNSKQAKNFKEENKYRYKENFKINKEIKKKNLDFIDKIIFLNIIQNEETDDCLSPTLSNEIFKFLKLPTNENFEIISKNSEDFFENLKNIFYKIKINKSNLEIYFTILISENGKLDNNSEKVIGKTFINSLYFLINDLLLKNLLFIKSLFDKSHQIKLYSFFKDVFKKLDDLYIIKCIPLRSVSYYQLIFFNSVLKIKNWNYYNKNVYEIYKESIEELKIEEKKSKKNLFKENISSCVYIYYKNKIPEYSFENMNYKIQENKKKTKIKKHIKIFLPISVIRMGKSFLLNQLANYFSKTENNFLSFFISSDENRNFKMNLKKFEMEEKKEKVNRDILFQKTRKVNKIFNIELENLFKKILKFNKSKFAILLDKNYMPNDYTLNFIKNIQKILKSYSFSYEFILLHINSPSPIKNLKLKNRNISFYFSLKMILDLFLRLKNTKDHLTLSDNLNKNLEILLMFLNSFFNYDVFSYFNELENCTNLFVDFFRIKNKKFNFVCMKYLTVPFFNMLFSWKNYDRSKGQQKEKFKNTFEKNRDYFYLTIENFLNKFSVEFNIMKNYLPNKFMFSEFVKKKTKIINQKNFYKNLETYNYSKILYFGIFFESFESQVDIQYQKILSSEIPPNYSYIKKIISIISEKKKFEDIDIRYPPNYHVTICYLNGRLPLKKEEYIINSYTYQALYKLKSKYLVIINKKIGFVIMDKNESIKSLNTFKHTTIFFSGKYMAKHSNDMAQLIENEILNYNYIYKDKKGFYVYLVKDLFDNQLTNHAFVWCLRDEFEGNFDFEEILN